MSTSTDALLVYGHDLGELYDDEDPAWFDEDSDEDMITQAWAALIAANGGPLEGVQLIEHCSSREPLCLLVAVAFEASRGHPETVDFTVPDDADSRLSWALGVLGIRPKAEKPAWLLASWWETES